MTNQSFKFLALQVLSLEMEKKCLALTEFSVSIMAAGMRLENCLLSERKQKDGKRKKQKQKKKQLFMLR